MTPGQARAARAMLNLSMKAVCSLTTIGKRTLTEFESGSRSINEATLSKLKAFYIGKGISFSDKVTSGNEAVILNHGDSNLDAGGEINDKHEYIDYFDTETINKTLSEITVRIEALQSKCIFSQIIILKIMRKKLVNQKQLSAILGCSTSFINAIIVGKKFISAMMAAKIDLIYNDLNATVVLRSEKKLLASLDLIRTSISDSRLEVEKFFQSHPKTINDIADHDPGRVRGTHAL